MTVVGATLDGFEPLSPELVLVAPAEERARALALLPSAARFAPQRHETTLAGRAQISFAAFCGTCAVMTLAPLALIVFAH